MSKASQVNLNNYQELNEDPTEIKKLDIRLLTRGNCFDFILLPMLCNILRKWVIRIWCTQQSLNTASRILEHVTF